MSAELTVRVVDFYAEFPAPDYTITPGTMWQASDGHWAMCCPICKETAGMAKHTVTINADGTPSVSPSIICPTYRALGGEQRGGCHYFLTNGVVRLA